MPREIWTIGHSNRAIDSLVALLKGPAIVRVADVRRFPSSARHPQFNQAALERALAEHGIGYQHFEELGGRRQGRVEGSINTAWRVAAFNSYADYMDSPEFQAALGLLGEQAETRRTAVMCAEALPWQCHRRLIADALIVRGWTVWDIIGPAPPKQRTLTEFARAAAGRLTYPGEPLFPEA